MNENFTCNCGGEIELQTETYVLHRCKTLAAQKQLGDVLVPYTRVLLNTNGATQYRWFVDWKAS